MFFIFIYILKISAALGNSNKPPCGAYLSKRVLREGVYSRGAVIREWGLNRSFTNKRLCVDQTKALKKS